MQEVRKIRESWRYMKRLKIDPDSLRKGIKEQEKVIKTLERDLNILALMRSEFMARKLKKMDKKKLGRTAVFVGFVHADDMEPLLGVKAIDPGNLAANMKKSQYNTLKEYQEKFLKQRARVKKEREERKQKNKRMRRK